MNAQELRNLSEAYMEVYDELDEAAKRFPKKKRGSKDTKSYQDGRSQAGMMVSGDSQVSGAGYMRRGGGKQTQTDPNERQPQQGRMDRYTRDEMEYRKARLKKEETDLYDIILSHLLDEGYASTEESADKIILNMSESWFEQIVEDYVVVKKDGSREIVKGDPPKPEVKSGYDYTHTEKQKEKMKKTPKTKIGSRFD